MGRSVDVSDEFETVDVKAFISEKYLQNNIIVWLNESTDGYFWQNDSVGIKGRKRENKFRPNGVADILGVIDGQFVAIEVKAPKGKVSKSQIEFSQRFSRSGGSYYVVRSIEDLTELAKVNGWV
jgi:hypothetical protein